MTSKTAQPAPEAPQKTRLERQADKGQAAVDGLVKLWLDAEQVHIKLWLDAETKFTKDVTAWLDAETRFATAETLADSIASNATGAVDAANLASQYLEALFDGMTSVKEGKYFRELGHESYPKFTEHVCKTHLTGLDGGAKKEVVRFVIASIPGMTERKYAEITGVPQAQVNRAKKGSTAGDGDSGHGGKRDSKTDADKLAAATDKVTPAVLADVDKVSVDDLKRIAAEALRVLIDARAQLAARGETVAVWASLEPSKAEVHSSSEGTVNGTIQRKAAA